MSNKLDGLITVLELEPELLQSKAARNPLVRSLQGLRNYLDCIKNIEPNPEDEQAIIRAEILREVRDTIENKIFGFTGVGD